MIRVLKDAGVPKADKSSFGQQDALGYSHSATLPYDETRYNLWAAFAGTEPEKGSTKQPHKPEALPRIQVRSRGRKAAASRRRSMSEQSRMHTRRSSKSFTLPAVMMPNNAVWQGPHGPPEHYIAAPQGVSLGLVPADWQGPEMWAADQQQFSRTQPDQQYYMQQQQQQQMQMQMEMQWQYEQQEQQQQQQWYEEEQQMLQGRQFGEEYNAEYLEYERYRLQMLQEQQDLQRRQEEQQFMLQQQRDVQQPDRGQFSQSTPVDTAFDYYASQPTASPPEAVERREALRRLLGQSQQSYSATSTLQVG